MYLSSLGLIPSVQDLSENGGFITIKSNFFSSLNSSKYTNQSTAVMENLHQLASAGCTMQGLCTITRKESRWGDEEPAEVMGIRFTLN